MQTFRSGLRELCGLCVDRVLFAFFFLRSALPLVEAESGTITWYALQEGPSSFAIFDTFDTEAGRDAHLNGKVAAALMAKAADLFAKPPAIHKIDILIDKLPKTGK